MNYKIMISNPGNHTHNPLLKLRGNEYATREEACEAIYAAMYDVLDSAGGCEMVDPPDWNSFGEDDAAYARAKDAYDQSCHDFILREGWACENGVSATVEEVGGEKTENLINLINAHPELHAELINGLVEVTPSSGEPLTEQIEGFVRRIAGNAPFELATLINRDNESDRLSFEVDEDT